MSGPDERNSGPMKEDADIPSEVRETYARLQSQNPDGPPDLVDQAVLNRARAAVDKPHSSRPWSFGWPHALSTVAVIVLSLTVLIQLREQTPPAMTTPASAPGPARNFEPNVESNIKPGADVAPGTSPSTSTSTRAITGAPAPAAAEADREVLADESENGSSLMLMEAAEEAPADAVLQKAESRQRAATQDNDTSPARTSEPLRGNPEAWLLEIRRLREEGLVEQADEELALFRESWPDIPVPEDLE